MKIYSDKDNLPLIDHPVVTMGTFDGVHIGHQSILKRLKDIAEEENGETVIVTFDPHPRMVIKLDHENLRFLNTLQEKKKLFDIAGIDHLVLLKFTSEFSKMKSEDFIKKILIEQIHAKTLIIGYDHHFGKERKGDFNHLLKMGEQFGFNVLQVDAADVEGDAVSSTKIRKALIEGEIQKANKYLGYKYSLTGNVVGGKGIGKKINFPTANISVQDSNKLIPANGVYAVYIEYKGLTYKGMLSIGSKPTFNDEEENVEVNIFDFNEDLYGKELTVYFQERLRDIEKYKNADALKEQLTLDMKTSLELL